MKVRATLAAGVTAAVLVGVGVAWACTPQASVSSVAPNSGPEGTTVTVTGEGFSPGPVEIRWGGHSGPVIGMATAEVVGTNTSFLTSVTIPKVAPGGYQLVAISRRSGSYFSGVAPFQVTAAAPEARDPKPPAPEDPLPAEPVPTDPGPAAPVPSQSVPGEPTSGEAPSRVTPPEPAPVPRSAVTPEPNAAAPSPPPLVLPAPAPAADRSTALPATAGPPPAPLAASIDLALPSQVSGDLWSGFASGPEAISAASLGDGREAPDRATPGLAIGIALLVAGLVALVTASGAEVMTRRRARARSAG